VPNTDVKQSKASVCLPANNGIMCSNPVLGMSICLSSSCLCCHICAAALWQANILSRCPTRCLALRFRNLKKGETLHCFHMYQRRGEIRTALNENVKSTTWEVFGLNSGWLWLIILHYIHQNIHKDSKPISFLLSLYYHCTSYDNMITYQVHTVLSQPKNQSNNCRDSNVYKQLGKNRAEVIVQTGL